MAKHFFLIVSLLFITACGQEGFQPLSIEDGPELNDNEVLLGDMIVEKSNVIGYGLEPEEAQVLADKYLQDLDGATEDLGDGEVSAAGVMESGRRKWPNGRLPIKFAKGFSQAQKDYFFSECKKLGRRAKVRCVDAGSSTNFIRVITGNSGCGWSYVGMIGGRQDLFVGRSCWGNGRVIKHELMHALGMAHEHNHPNRGDKVAIKWNNIEEDYKHNFYRVKSSYRLSNYNFNSIMHYHSHAFSKNGKKTIVKINNPSSLIPYSTVMTNSDHVILEKVYGKK